MATKKNDQPPEPRPNREQRRREKFGKAGGITKEPWPTSEANPALSGSAGDQAAYTGDPDQDLTHHTGPGSGGATEGAGRIVHREGIRSGDSAKG
jgi:hypothetical protein